MAAGAWGLHRSPAVSEVGHAGIAQRNTATKQLNMLGSSYRWMMQYQLHPLPAESVLLP